MKQPKPKPTPKPEFFNPNPDGKRGYCWLTGAPLGQFGPGGSGVEKVKKIQ